MNINAMCIAMEGLFNTLGHDVLGMNTIVPLFLADLGASLGLIGLVNTMRTVLGGIVPPLVGGMVDAAPSKRGLSILLNGIGRGSILLIPLALFLGARGGLMIALFFMAMFIYQVNQPITGITWNYLLGNCVPPEQRGQLLGMLFGVSGVITFGSGALVKAIRANEALSPMRQYAWIFLLGGLLMASSVLWYLPLKERRVERGERKAQPPFEYIRSLAGCFENKDYTRSVVANVLSSVSVAVSAFFLVFARDALNLSTDTISNLIIAQTLGIMLGGFIAGRVSARFGVQRMLVAAESAALLIPALGWTTLATADGAGSIPPVAWVAAAMFLIGFTRSGLVGYQAYILEVIDPAKSVGPIVAKNLAMLPFSFAGAVIGWYLDGHGYHAVFAAQFIVGCLALFCVAGLKRTVYPSATAANSPNSHQTA
ncbi:MAG: MFS transporter [Oscillospiraceae bacterium]|jgi:MFS family permease|nr:MFS transporter [Oscillospiraceae bacterium]